MVQRQTSTSSNGSASARGLQRRDSGGSMTERTFRTPSPNRPTSNRQDEAPPVPPLPKNYGAHKRAASLEPQMRVMSPVSKAPGGRGASLDRAPPKKKTPQPALDDIEELERTNSRNSVNFSYPRGAQPNSPPTSPTSSNRPSSESFEASNVRNSLSQTASKPVKKKKKKIAPGATEGSHLASGGMGGKPHVAEADRDSKLNKSKARTKKRVVLSSGSDSDSTPEKAGRKSQRASGQLNKQPSVVREDWEGEQVVDEASSPISSIDSAAFLRPEKVAANSSKKVESPSQPTAVPVTLPTPPSEPTEYLEVKESPKPRVPSISPSRSTRFSAQIASEMLGGGRHEPPPRSLSPAKPALKHHSPSSQSRSLIDGGGSGGWKRSSQTPSEASDNISLTSADGTKKRRAMHVSFGAEPEIVDVADPGQKKSWANSSKPQHLDTIKAEDDMEEVMRPRPALPSFGSIRGKKERSETRAFPAGKVSNLSSSASSSESNLPNTMETSVSSDQVIGHILAQNDAKQSASPIPTRLDPNLPLPPEVTSVEGTGYVSDNSSIFSNDEPIDEAGIDPVAKSTRAERSPIAEPGELTISTNKPIAKARAEEVPVIAVQPATPGSGTMPMQDEWLVDVPGGFPASTETFDSHSRRHSLEGTDLPITSPADIGIAEPKPLEAARAQDSSTPAIGTVSQSLLQQTQAESDAESTGGESIYSDAAEDVADLEGDGFGSINAILESPISSPLPKQSPPASPVVSKLPERRRDSWDQAQAHWKEIAERQRQTASQEATKPEPIAIPPKSKARKGVSSPPIINNSSPPESPDRPLPISSSYPPVAVKSPSQDVPMRKSMRSPPPKAQESGPMRKSMRSPPPEVPEAGPLRQSMRSPPLIRGTKKAPQPAQLPSKSAMRSTGELPVHVAPGKQPKGALQKRSIPAVTPAPTPKPTIRTMSNNSDSDSSFRKVRRTKNSDRKYSMRRSMRSPTPTQRPQSVDGSSRPLSPETRRPFTSGGQGALRSTMRSSVDAGTPSLRGHSRQRPASSGGFSKRSSAPPASTKFKSRFGDDSDDGDAPRLFRSRFEDSSDDEPEPLSLRPVRGIPRKTDDGDSTDLNDSSDDGKKAEKPKVHIAPPMAEDTHAVRRRSSGSGRDVTKSADPPTKKKGIFGRFRSTKDHRVAKPVSESSARRDTHLERSPAELEQARSPVGPGSPTGKLQRRNMPQRVMSESWPLPEAKEEGLDKRPGTSDGVVQNITNGRPSMMPRENTSSTVRTEGGTPVYGRSGKKKRFPMLRKALGLHD